MTQREYIEILFTDLGFTPSQRKAWLKDKWLTDDIDKLGNNSKSLIINHLKEWKEERKNY